MPHSTPLLSGPSEAQAEQAVLEKSHKEFDRSRDRCLDSMIARACETIREGGVGYHVWFDHGFRPTRAVIGKLDDIEAFLHTHGIHIGSGVVKTTKKSIPRARHAMKTAAEHIWLHRLYEYFLKTDLTPSWPTLYDWTEEAISTTVAWASPAQGLNVHPLPNHARWGWWDIGIREIYPLWPWLPPHTNPIGGSAMTKKPPPGMDCGHCQYLNTSNDCCELFSCQTTGNNVCDHFKAITAAPSPTEYVGDIGDMQNTLINAAPDTGVAGVLNTIGAAADAAAQAISKYKVQAVKKFIEEAKKGVGGPVPIIALEQCIDDDDEEDEEETVVTTADFNDFDGIHEPAIQQEIEWASGEYTTTVHRFEPEDMAGFLGTFHHGVNIAELKEKFGGGTYRIEVRGPGLHGPKDTIIIYGSTLKVAGEPLPPVLQPQAEPQMTQEALDNLMAFATAEAPAPHAIQLNISDFPSGKVHAPSLATTLGGTPLGLKVLAVEADPVNGICRIDFSDKLGAAEMLLLNSIIGAHPGDGSPGALGTLIGEYVDEPAPPEGTVEVMPPTITPVAPGAIKYTPVGGGLHGDLGGDSSVVTTTELAPNEIQYSISSDFPSNTVDDVILIHAIDDTIEMPVEHVSIDPDHDVCIIGFDEVLSPAERKLLDGIVANHQRRGGHGLKPIPKPKHDQFSLVRSLVAAGTFKKNDEEES